MPAPPGTRSLTVAARFCPLILLFALPAWSEPPRRDAYGDPLPKGARYRLGTVRLRHNGITNLAWLPAGNKLATAGWDGTVRLWQIPGGKQLFQWNKANKMEDVLFSPNGRIAACGGRKRAIRLVDVETGKELRRLRTGKIDLSAEAFSPDGKILAAVEWKTFLLFEWTKAIRLYAVDSGKEIRRLAGKIPSEHALAFTPDGRSLAVASKNGVFCYNLRSGEKSKPLLTDPARSLVFSPDGKMLAAVIGTSHRADPEPRVALLRWPMGKELERFHCEGHFYNVSLAFSPDGKNLAFSDDKAIHLCKTASGKEVRWFNGDAGSCLAFSPDGSLLASGFVDVTLWEVRPKATPRSLTGRGHRISAVAMTPDGRTLLTHSGDGALALWDGRDGCRLRTLAHSDDVDQLFLTSDGCRALAFPSKPEESILCWDVASGRRLPIFTRVTKRITSIALSPDGSRMALGDTNGIIHLQDTAKGGKVHHLKAQPEKEDTPSVSEAAFSPDGRTLAAGYSDGRLILWSVGANRPRPCSFIYHFKDTWKLAFSTDSRLLALIDSEKKAIHLIETATGQEFRRLTVRDHPSSIASFAFAPDNRTLAVGGEPPSDFSYGIGVDFTFGFGQSAIHLWDWPSGKPNHVLHGHCRKVHTLAFSADGTSLISGSDDETVLCWDVADLMRRRPASKELSAARLTELWTDLAAKDAERGQSAVAELILASDAALPFLAKALPPIPMAKGKRIAALIADLDSDEFTHRERASKELQKMGEPAAPALRKVLSEKPTLEVRKRITAILDSIEQGEISPHWLRTLRVLQVLEAIGSPRARQILDALAHGSPEAGLTQEAKKALQRLDRRRGKP